MKPRTFLSVAVFLILSIVDVGVCLGIFFCSFFFGENHAVGLLVAGAAIGIAHAGLAYALFRRFLPEFAAMTAASWGLAALLEKNDEGSYFHLLDGFATSCLLGAAFFLAAMAFFHVLGLMRKSRVKPMTFGSVSLSSLLAIPASCVWYVLPNVFLWRMFPLLEDGPVFLQEGVLAGVSCAVAWFWFLKRRDANYWIEFTFMLIAYTLLSFVYALMGHYPYDGNPGLAQLIGAALFAALAVPLSFFHRRKKAAAKAEAGEWLDARIASAGEGVDVLSDLAGGPMVSVGSPATLAAVRDCLRGARWLPKAKFLKEGDKTAPDTRLDMGGNVAENGVFWFRSPGTGREQAFVFAEKDWERLAGLAAA
ncbi:MAG: hypothetical protein LBG71_00945, partial [Clostridiales Family XIII bacterium]|nr:hypothetical protein [Clostridiales Family XIII bacterium]